MGSRCLFVANPPTVSNTHFNNLPHCRRAEGRTSFETDSRMILIGLLSSEMISVLLAENYRLKPPPSLSLCYIQGHTNGLRSHCGQKLYANAGQKWGWDLWVKRRRGADKSLISLFAFVLACVWRRIQPMGGGWGDEEQSQSQVVWSPRGE